MHLRFNRALEELRTVKLNRLTQIANRRGLQTAHNAFITRSLGAPKLVEAGAADLEKAISESATVDTAASLRDNAQFIAVKDNIVTGEGRSTAASKILENHQSPLNASVVESLQRRNRIVIGKTNLDEFGMGSHSTNSHFGPVHNISPLSEYSAGGSSGGSAVAVATGQVQIALGTDTGGSVRLPAAYTGVVGFKPSYGLISRWGVIPYANSLDTVGIFAAEVGEENGTFGRTVEAAMNVDEKDPTNLTARSRKRLEGGPHARLSLKPGQKIRIGVPIEYNIDELDPLIRDTWQSVLEDLQSQGEYEIIPVSLPSTKQALSAYYVLAAGEAASNLSKYDGVRFGSRGKGADGAGGVLYAQTRREGLGDEVRKRILLGSYTLSSEAMDNYFIKAQKIRRLVQRDFDRVLAMPNALRPDEQFDLSEMDENVGLVNKLGPAQVHYLICPTTPTPPPTLEEVARQTSLDAYINDVFTVPASLAGLPAISVPVKGKQDREDGGKKASSVGIQVISQYGHDWSVIGMARKIESICGFRSGHYGTENPQV